VEEMSRVFSVGPAPGKGRAPATAIVTAEDAPATKDDTWAANSSTASQAKKTNQSTRAPEKTKGAQAAASASTQELMDELCAIAGNDGERANTIEGRETATEYSRRVKASVAEREEQVCSPHEPY